MLDVYCSFSLVNNSICINITPGLIFNMFLLDNLGQSYFSTIENFLENKLQTVRDRAVNRI